MMLQGFGLWVGHQDPGKGATLTASVPRRRQEDDGSEGHLPENGREEDLHQHSLGNDHATFSAHVDSKRQRIRNY
jgi:hypothetical protein